MHQIDSDTVYQYALDRLERELPAALVYHSLAHTRDMVVPEAEQLAAQAGLDEEALLLLRTAAYFHDLGFVHDRAEHEAIGAQIAADQLPSFGYSATQIEAIRDIIMATRLPQTPRDLLGQLLADADLAVFGRIDFMEWNTRLRDELRAYNNPCTDEYWYRTQLHFMESHSYWTEAARQRYNATKQHNCDQMRALLAQATNAAN